MHVGVRPYAVCARRGSAQQCHHQQHARHKCPRQWGFPPVTACGAA
jgi:hypothetical protein